MQRRGRRQPGGSDFETTRDSRALRAGPPSLREAFSSDRMHCGDRSQDWGGRPHLCPPPTAHTHTHTHTCARAPGPGLWDLDKSFEGSGSPHSFTCTTGALLSPLPLRGGMRGRTALQAVKGGPQQDFNTWERISPPPPPPPHPTLPYRHPPPSGLQHGQEGGSQRWGPMGRGAPKQVHFLSGDLFSPYRRDTPSPYTSLPPLW